MIFELIKEIKSKDDVLHFRRWRVLSTPWFKICLHAIYKADDDKYLHNHPWNFIGVVLKGSYTEIMTGSKLITRLPGMFVKRTRDQFHKVEDLHSPVVYTLNFMWGFKNEWGYMVGCNFVNHEEYRKRKNNGQI